MSTRINILGCNCSYLQNLNDAFAAKSRMGHHMLVIMRIRAQKYVIDISAEKLCLTYDDLEAYI